MPDADSPLDYIRRLVDERTDADGDLGQNATSDVWCGRRNLLTTGKKFSCPFTDAQLEAAFEDLLAEGDLFFWHGLVAPATDEHLRTIIEAERASDEPRKILIGQVNQRLHGGGS